MYADIDHVFLELASVVDLGRIILSKVSLRNNAELANEPNADGDVNEHEKPVAHQHKEDGKDQLEPKLRNIPKVEARTTLLSI